MIPRVLHGAFLYLIRQKNINNLQKPIEIIVSLASGIIALLIVI
jgi:hypothetical protein